MTKITNIKDIEVFDGYSWTIYDKATNTISYACSDRGFVSEEPNDYWQLWIKRNTFGTKEYEEEQLGWKEYQKRNIEAEQQWQEEA